ncbi:hypothetical protein J1N35_003472 [Gossypium stocksii]|uniref:RNase H type-1 domain-containing protein n=1 Tax=Gossypium stocksii TaxID=47602 RepID=A0A9D3WAB0_9ROSI|nr:hypothetical protein J1N35_003472 [Gossypium stocksii]
MATVFVKKLGSFKYRCSSKIGFKRADRVLRNGNGEWILMVIGIWGNVYAELWGTLNGLVLLQRHRYGKVVTYSNNLQVIKGIQDSSLVISNSTLVRRIHQNLVHKDN